eukprot:4372571-Alexandrium_andersonii.AAC.1
MAFFLRVMNAHPQAVRLSVGLDFHCFPPPTPSAGPQAAEEAPPPWAGGLAARGRGSGQTDWRPISACNICRPWIWTSLDSQLQHDRVTPPSLEHRHAHRHSDTQT